MKRVSERASSEARARVRRARVGDRGFRGE
jgi:hypothetical protein